ncbi:MAG: hypothetical protein E7D73_05040, partial [Klebsiella sp.]|nr:hypothetical protein [Klebsiella sp.]
FISKLALVLDIYSSLSLIWRYSYCLVFQGATSLRMHSLGGMHLLICLKHRHAQGTGNLLSQLYDSTGSYDFGNSFKQSNCDNCTDCKPREDGWSWSLKWYSKEVERYKDLLNKYKF